MFSVQLKSKNMFKSILTSVQAYLVWLWGKLPVYQEWCKVW